MPADSPPEHYSFDRLAAMFDDLRGLPPSGLAALHRAFTDLASTGARTLIEPGAGTGRIAIPALAAGFDVTAIDHSRPMLDAFRAHLKAAPELAAHADLIIADALSLPVADDSFDIGVLAQVLYLVPDWPLALTELARVVRPGGVILLVQERTTMSSELSDWDAAWRDITEEFGQESVRQEPDNLAASAALAERSVDVRESEIASWSFGETAENRIAGLDRLRPLYPSFNQTAWEEVSFRFRTWYATSGIDADTWLGGSVALTLVNGTVGDSHR